MHQGSLRSYVYRYFVTCDDPGGIVECKTIRRSKAAKKIGGKVENAKSETNLVTTSQKDIRKETSSKGPIDKLDSSSSVRLKEVADEAQKLGEAVDSLSTNRLESQSEDIAKKLLKGAVSLQESLKMLGKFQEASKFMTSFRKKDKSGDGKSLERSSSERFTNHCNVVEFQKPRLSADGGSSKDCYDELRDVIRENFARQKKGSSEGRESAERDVDSSVDTPSASSSQSSTFNSHDFISSGSSSTNVQSERPKGSNLIAKLMGLDELTSNPVQFIPYKPLEKSCKSTNKRPILDLDLDLPIARKPSFIAHKAKPDQRTLGEIIEIMQSKGLMRDKSFDEPTREWHPYEVAEFSDNSPPIVVIKPMHKSILDKEYPHIKNCTCGRASSHTKEMPKLWRTRSVSSENVNPQEDLNKSKMQTKTIGDMYQVPRIGKEKTTKTFGQARQRPKLKESEIQDHKSPIRPITSSQVAFRLQKGEVIEKRVDKIHRVAPKVKNGEGRNQIKESNSGRATISKANHQRNINSKQMNSISREPITSSNKVLQNKSIIFRSRTTNPPTSSAKHKKSLKTGKLSDKRSRVAVEIIGNGTIDIEINPESDNEDRKMETRIIPEPESSKEGRDVSDIFSRDDTKPSSEATEIIINQNFDAVCDQSDDSEVNSISSSNGSWKYQTTVRALLSSSESFLNHAEELYNTTASQLPVGATSLDNDEVPDAKLILHCATELLECRCQQWELTLYPLLQHPKNRPKISASFEHLVGKICDEIGELKDNSNLSSGDLHIDYFYAMLKKDLWCNRAVAGSWDLGWVNAFTWDEVEQVVDDIEIELLGRIVEDLVSYFSL